VTVISNTTVISNFAVIGQIDLLHRVYGQIALAMEVYEEIQAGMEEGYKFYSDIEGLIHPKNSEGWLRLAWLESGREVELFTALPSRLHPGERASLAIAQNRDWLFLTDDRAARNLAQARGIQLSGSLGCLIAGIDLGLWNVSEANHWLSEMVTLGFYTPTSDLTDYLVAE
jgi:hypothetical protein